MIERIAEQRVTKLASQFGVVSITGPRQSGKTTLTRKLFPTHRYINFENLIELDQIKQDPLGFIQSIQTGVILDEVQKYPEILSFIQVSIDENFKPGKFIITGSQNLLLLEKVSQSLAGRVALVELLPLSITELYAGNVLPKDKEDQILTGFYPAIYDKQIDAGEYYNSYISTYVERDVRSIKNIGDMTTFVKCLSLLAGRIGQLLNYSDLANSLGVDEKTVKAWISVLEASYIIFTLQPYYNNFGKRTIKSPKIYFVDTGLATSLLNIDTTQEIRNYYALGSLFENMVIGDMYKSILNTGSTDNLYFYRDKSGKEVDLVIDKGNVKYPIEIKSSHSYRPEYIQSLEYFNSLTGQQEIGSVIYAGETVPWSPNGVRICNYKDTKVYM